MAEEKKKRLWSSTLTRLKVALTRTKSAIVDEAVGEGGVAEGNQDAEQASSASTAQPVPRNEVSITSEEEFSEPEKPNLSSGGHHVATDEPKAAVSQHEASQNSSAFNESSEQNSFWNSFIKHSKK
ncbi:MAG: hypothetical protein K2Z81_20005, partial [Cyanobacteria bacterium]|nr:hypothetical protein [Cyanobacteriota bacterium]